MYMGEVTGFFNDLFYLLMILRVLIELRELCH